MLEAYNLALPSDGTDCLNLLSWDSWRGVRVQLSYHYYLVFNVPSVQLKGTDQLFLEVMRE